MNNEFYTHIYHRHRQIDRVPPNEVIAAWATGVLQLIYPELSPSSAIDSADDVSHVAAGLEQQLTSLLRATKVCSSCNHAEVSAAFFAGLPELYRKLNNDIVAMLAGDPAAKDEFEVIRAYPGFFAIAMYRIAHQLLLLEVPLIPRILTEWAHARTGIDIHPGARIGEFLYIDHGTGMVIGETTVIGDHVKLYQGVTLGALSVEKYMADTKRHPTIEDRAIIYSGATILGGETVIGHDCVIGGNVWLTRSVPPHSTVYHQPIIKVVESKVEE